MNDPSPWLTFWTVVLLLGLGSFYLVVLIVIPLGARDVKRMLSSLGTARRERTADAMRSQDSKTDPRDGAN